MAIEVVRYPRGSVPLILSLEEAFEIVRKIAGGIANADVLSRILGNSASSSSFVKKINALRTYGLIEQQNGDFMLTETGGFIAAPTSPEVEASAKRDAFLKIEVFAKVFDRHKGKLLPADEFLRNLIEQECKIPKELSTEWVEKFKIAANLIGLLYKRPDGKIQIMDSPIVRFPRTTPEIIEREETSKPHEVIAPDKPSNATNKSFEFPETGHVTRIELSQKRLASISIPDQLTQKDAQKLKSAFRGFEAIIDSMVSDGSE